jgi:hypothetical protein
MVVSCYRCRTHQLIRSDSRRRCYLDSSALPLDQGMGSRLAGYSAYGAVPALADLSRL